MIVGAQISDDPEISTDRLCGLSSGRASRAGAGSLAVNRLGDPVLLLLGGLLFLTLAAFAAGVLPYPFGWTVLSVLLLARVLSR